MESVRALPGASGLGALHRGRTHDLEHQIRSPMTGLLGSPRGLLRCVNIGSMIMDLIRVPREANVDATHREHANPSLGWSTHKVGCTH